MMFIFKLLLGVASAASLKVSPAPPASRPEPAIPSVQAMLDSACGPKCASVIAGSAPDMTRRYSQPVSALGGAPLCKTEFVQKSFTDEDLIQTEKNVVQWLLDLSAK